MLQADAALSEFLYADVLLGDLQGGRVLEGRLLVLALHSICNIL